MHFLSPIIARLFWPLAYLSNLLSEQLAGGRAPSLEMSLSAAFIVASVVVGVASSIWAAIARAQFVFLRRSMRRELAQSRAVLLLRDAIIEGCSEAIVVMGVDMSVPLAFGGGSSILQDCLSGADAATLAVALDRLLETGADFEMVARISHNRTVRLRGYPIGRRAVVFLRYLEAEVVRSASLDALDSLPIPIWLRDSNLHLIWANRTFVAFTGARNVEEAVKSGIGLHKSELDLARSVREFGRPIEARRYVMAGATRSALVFNLELLADGNVIGSARDVTDAAQAEARLKLQADSHAEVLDSLETGVAIFDTNRQLLRFNEAFVRLWDFPRDWLDTKPRAGDILDRLREQRKLPEQRDYAGWKLDWLALCEDSDHKSEEYWHLPSGRSIRVSAAPDLLGGLTVLFEDVSDRLHLESSYTNLIRVQRATLDTLDDGVAVFGPDGRLKLGNSSFASLWKLPAADLAEQPHVNRLAEHAGRVFGRDNTWAIISSALASDNPGSFSRWGAITRPDGKKLSLSFTRLPDGATMTMFTDDTNTERLDEILHSSRRSSA